MWEVKESWIKSKNKIKLDKMKQNKTSTMKKKTKKQNQTKKKKNRIPREQSMLLQMKVNMHLQYEFTLEDYVLLNPF